MVPVGGLEPPLPREPDFESSVSTNFTTLAFLKIYFFCCWDVKSLADFESPVSTNFTTLACAATCRRRSISGRAESAI